MVINHRRLQLDELLPLVYDDLRNYASHALQNERSGHTLQTTALVHEAYVRLARLKEIDWEKKGDVLRASVGIMRRVLIDFARAKKAKKRDVGHLLLMCPKEGFSEAVMPPSFDLLALDEALKKLRVFDQAKADVVELRYFGGQTLQDVADILDVSLATVKRHWAFAKAWLFRELNEDESCG